MLQPTTLAQFRACFAQVKDLWPVRYADLYVSAGRGAARGARGGRLSCWTFMDPYAMLKPVSPHDLVRGVCHCNTLG